MVSSCHVHDDGADGGGQGTGLLALGTSLVIGACFVSTFGVNLQKLAHLRNEKLPPQHRQPYAKLFTWQLGMLLMVMGSLMDMLALPFVPQSRVAVLGSVAMVANVVITPVFLKEQLTTYDLAGCFITVAGCSLATYFGSTSEIDLTPDCLVDSLVEPGFLLYFALVCAYLGILLVFILARERREAENADSEDSASSSATSGVGSSVAHEEQHDDEQSGAFQLFDALDGPFGQSSGSKPVGRWFDLVPRLPPKADAFVYASFAGTVGAQSIMFAKATLEMGYSAIQGRVTVWYLFLCLPPFGLCLWCQVNFLNQALKLFDALYVVPVYQIFWIVMGILSGLIFYQEYRNLDPFSSWMFTLGCVINLAGVITLSQRQPSNTQPEDGNLSTGLLNSEERDAMPVTQAMPFKADDLPSASDELNMDEYKSFDQEKSLL